MDPFTHMELAKLRGRELQRQAERYYLSTALTPTFTPAQTKLDLLRDRLAVLTRRRRPSERPQPIGG
jgi:hypothetical protein